MDMGELDQIELSVKDLLFRAQVELEEKRLQQERNNLIQQKTEEIQARLRPLLEKVEEALAALSPDDFVDSITRQQLEEKAQDLRHTIDGAVSLAEQFVDQQLISDEEKLLDSHQSELLERWRQQLREDLLEMIQDQTDFYSATDAAIAIRGYAHDLKAIGALEEVVEALIEQINAHSEEGPVARLRGSHEQTLGFIYNKALENRARVERSYEVQPRVRHRTSEKRPNPYAELAGKVVIFGGHDRLETAVRNRLRDSGVDLVWCTAQAGPQIAEQTESHISSADLVLIVTGYTSHKLTDKAMKTARRLGQTPEMVNTTGVVRVLEAIEYALKTKQLEKHFKQISKPA
jgi:hypothetical protein